jgi:nucleoprotein TPR
MPSQSEEFSKTRESLIEAETSKKHLEERLGELSRQLHGNEARLAVYDRRPDGPDASLQSIDSGSNREQQLESGIAELRY